MHQELPDEAKKDIEEMENMLNWVCINGQMTQHNYKYQEQHEENKRMKKK